MPRVKNVDCVACEQRIHYEYAIHRKTFWHKLHSARYTPSGSMVYYDSVDLDKTCEKIDCQALRNYNKEADIITKKIKKQQNDAIKLQQRHNGQIKKTSHRKFEKQRRLAAKEQKHLQPKASLNVLQKKMAKEADVIYRQQLADFNSKYNQPCYDDQEDLQHFTLPCKQVTNQLFDTSKKNFNYGHKYNSVNINNAQKIKPLLSSTQLNDTNNTDCTAFTSTKKHTPCLTSVKKHPKQLLSSNFLSAKISPTALSPISNSSGLNNTLSSNTQHSNTNIYSEFTNAVVQNISFLHTQTVTSETDAQSKVILSENSTRHIQVNNDSDVHITDNFYANISQIPLPDSCFPKVNFSRHSQDYISQVSVFDSKATENISFYTSFYVQPTLPIIHIAQQTDNHVHYYSPPQSPENTVPKLKQIQPSFKLKRIDVAHKEQSNDKQLCRKCGSYINFNNLLIIANRLPPGRQILCAPCLLELTSKAKDFNVDYFNTV